MVFEPNILWIKKKKKKAVGQLLFHTSNICISFSSAELLADEHPVLSYRLAAGYIFREYKRL